MSYAAARAYDRTAHEPRSAHTSTLRAWNNAAKNYLIQYAVQLVFQQGCNQTTVRVAELACGRGGELLKWMQIAQSNDTTIDWRGSDVSSSSLEVLRTRFSAQRDARMVGDDADRFTLFDACQPMTMGELNALAPDGPVHIVSMQMAFHYVWRSPETLHTWCANVSRLLERGGVAVVTYFDACSVVNTRADRSFLGGCARIEFATEEDATRARTQAFVPYRFFMDGSVDGAVEYTVRARLLVRIARTYGLELLRAVRLVDLPVRHAKIDPNAAHAVLRGAMHGASADKTQDIHDMVDAARFYRGLVLVKTMRP